MIVPAGSEADIMHFVRSFIDGVQGTCWSLASVLMGRGFHHIGREDREILGWAMHNAVHEKDGQSDECSGWNFVGRNAHTCDDNCAVALVYSVLAFLQSSTDVWIG